MKRIIKYICITLSLILLFCGCRNNNTINETSSVPQSISSDITVSVDETSSEPVSSDDSSETTTSLPTSSVEQTTSVSQPASSVPVSVAPIVSTPAVTELPYNFNPENHLGLSEVRNGFSYGVAKNGLPHNISIENQKRFDGYSSFASALALDTVSQDKCVYLTFDCGWEYNNLTASILDTLKQKNVKAAFFCTLDYLKKNPTLVKRMIDEGHIVGNHSAKHKNFSTISRTEMAEELYGVEKYLKDTYNYYSPYFRFPEGVYTESALELVTSIGYRSIFWSLAHTDWDVSKQPTADAAYNTVTSRFHSGAVILLHAVSTANTQALPRIIDYAASNGYTFKTLDQYYS